MVVETASSTLTSSGWALRYSSSDSNCAFLSFITVILWSTSRYRKRERERERERKRERGREREREKEREREREREEERERERERERKREREREREEEREREGERERKRERELETFCTYLFFLHFFHHFVDASAAVLQLFLRLLKYNHLLLQTHTVKLKRVIMKENIKGHPLPLPR